MSNKTLLTTAMTREIPGYHQGALLQGYRPISAKRRAELIKRRQRAITELSNYSGDSMTDGKKTRIQVRGSTSRASDAKEKS